MHLIQTKAVLGTIKGIYSYVAIVSSPLYSYNCDWIWENVHSSHIRF